MLEKYNDDKDRTPFIQTRKHNNEIKEFMELKHTNDETLLDRLLPTAERRLEKKHNREKMSAYHQNQLQTYEAFCLAKQKELKMYLASALAQTRISLDVETKQKISHIYQEFRHHTDQLMKNSRTSFIAVLKDLEEFDIPELRQELIDEAIEQFERDRRVIQDMINTLINKINHGCDRI